MRDNDGRTIDRRTLLRMTGTTTTTAALAALAGCMGGGDGNGNGGNGNDSGNGNGNDSGNGNGGNGNGNDSGNGNGGDGLNELTITMSQFPDTIDPLNHITGDYFTVYDHIYEPLFDFVPGEGISGRIVEDWEHQGDGTTTLSLRDDVTFHNGDEMTAEDVAWTIDRTVDPEIGVVSDIGTFGLGSIEGAEASDETTVELSYGAAPGLAEFEIGNYGRAIDQQWAIDNYGADEEGEAIAGDTAEDFNGTGPYQVASFESGVEIVLEAYDDYWGEAPPFDQLTFNANGESSGRVAALETGETDLTINVQPTDAGTVQNTDGIEIRNVTSFRNIFCPMKNTVEPFDSQEFRQAMNYAVDNAGIIDSVLDGFGEARGQPVAPGINGFNDEIEPYAQNVSEAESLVEESGYGGVEIELTVPQGRYLNDAEVGETVADQINQLENVSCEANIVDFGVVSDANSAGVDPDTIEVPFYLIGWGTITGDTDYGVQGFFNVEDNPGRTFDDQELSDAIVESQQVEDPDERRSQLEEVNQLAREKAPFVFLHTQESIYGVNDSITWEPREDETIYAWEMES